MKALRLLTLSFVIILISFFVTGCTASKSANNSHITFKNPILNISQEEADKLYDKLLNEAMDKPAEADYLKLRMAYAAGSSYSPYGKDENLDKIVKLLKQEEYEVATEVVKTVHRVLFHDPLFHYYAFVAWKESGNDSMADIHSYYYHSLIHSILESGDGQSPQSAYYVISISEEYRILEYLELEFKEQSLVSKNGHTYDVMKSKNSEGKKSTTYFNIDLLFGSLGDMFDE